MLDSEELDISGERTTIVALAKDSITKSAFIFNSSAGLRNPSNQYKYLIEYFEITLKDMAGFVLMDGNYEFEEFSYTILDHLPYPNYNHEDQAEINIIKKQRIKEYNDNENYPLFNVSLNDKARVKQITERHNGNILKIYNDLHYKRLQKFYDSLNDLMQYDLVKIYVTDEENRLGEDITIQELSKRYFKGDNKAGIELLIRKSEDTLLRKIVAQNLDKINQWKDDFDMLVRAYRAGQGVIPLTIADFDTYLLLAHLCTDYWENSWDLMTFVCQKAKEKIIFYVENRDCKSEENALNKDYWWLRQKYVEELMHEYLCLLENEVAKKRIYLYAMYEKFKRIN